MSYEHYPTPTSSTDHSFDISSYLNARDEQPSFVMVEIGHGQDPVVHLQKNLTGQRAYVGIETWLRMPRIDLRRIHSGIQNCSFVDHQLYPDLDNDADNFITTYYQNKVDYDPQTILPDGAADEVILSNVFGDPMISRTDRTGQLLSEAARLLSPGGICVVRETITPHLARVAEEVPAIGGLRIIKHLPMKTVSNDWSKLEGKFNGLGLFSHSAAESYYLFIQKQVAAEVELISTT